jgi:transcription antitermination factor NusG
MTEVTKTDTSTKKWYVVRAISGQEKKVKQYIESFVEAVDCVMQAPIEFIVTQCFNFIDSEKATKQYKEQKTLFGMSGDIKLNKNFGISQTLS